MMMDEKSERCKACRGTNFTFSTEMKGNKWVWKKICKSCGEMLEERDLK